MSAVCVCSVQGALAFPLHTTQQLGWDFLKGVPNRLTLPSSGLKWSGSPPWAGGWECERELPFVGSNHLKYLLIHYSEKSGNCQGSSNSWPLSALARVLPRVGQMEWTSQNSRDGGCARHSWVTGICGIPSPCPGCCGALPWPSFNPYKKLWSWYNLPHFIDEKFKSQRVTFSKLYF